MKISIARFRLQYGLYLLVSLLALSACNTKEDPIDFDKITRGPLEQDTDIPFHLSMPLEEDPSTSRGLPMLGQKPNSPEYAPIRDWEHIDWYTPDNGSNPNSPHILVAISNARQTSPQGGAHEYFRKLLPSEYKIKINDVTKRPHIVIESYAKFKKGTLVDQYDVSVLVVDKDFANCDQFETTGKINFNTGDEFYDISSTGSQPKQFNSLAFVMNPVKIKPHMGKTGTADRDIHRPFKLLSTILVMEFADPTNKAANNQVKFESNGFTNQGVLSMKAADNPQSATSVLETPAPALLSKTFTESENLLGRNSAQEGRYTRIVAMALPTKKAGEAYSIKATYTENNGASGSKLKTRGYGLNGGLENSMSYAGKMLFVNFELDDAPRDPADYLQTVWDSGDDGRIGFYALGLYRRGGGLDPEVPSTHKAKVFYREVGTEQWMNFKLDGKSPTPTDKKYFVEIKDLKPRTRYDIWINGLGSFLTSKIGYQGTPFSGDESSLSETPDRLLELKNWGASNKWGGHKDQQQRKLFSGYPSSQDVIFFLDLAFVNATRLTVTAVDLPQLEEITTLSNLFDNAQAVATVPRINEWKLPAKENRPILCHATFRNAKNFNSPIGDWDVRHVVAMSSMFENTEKFNQDLHKWKMYSLREAPKMFKGAKAFNGAVHGWDMTTVVDMSEMFSGTESFNQPIGDWKLIPFKLGLVLPENVDRERDADQDDLNMSSMFELAQSFNQPLDSWKGKLSRTTNMRGMFSSTRKFNQDISSWDMSNLQNIEKMFDGAQAFNQPLDPWATTLSRSQINSLFSVFRRTKVFNQPLPNWKKVLKNVNNLSWMFMEAEAFDQPLDWGDAVSKVNNMTHMFSGTHRFNQPLRWDISQQKEAIDMTHMFSHAKAFNNALTFLHTPNHVTNMSFMFQGAEVYNHSDIVDWDVSNVEKMGSMFNRTKKFNQSLSRWNVSKVTDMSFMFLGAEVFNQDLSTWADKLGNVKRMSQMFNGAKAFNNTSIKDWKLGNDIELSTFWNFGSMSQSNIEIILNGWKQVAESSPGQYFNRMKVNKAMFWQKTPPPDETDYRFEQLPTVYPAFHYLINTCNWKEILY